MMEESKEKPKEGKKDVEGLIEKGKTLTAEESKQN